MRVVKKPERMNILLVGANYLGKTSFISTITKKETESLEEFSEHDTVISGVPIHFIECRGYGSTSDTANRFARIEAFIRERSKKFLVEETKVVRDPDFEDSRVHLVILFASVTHRGVKAYDLSLLSLLHKKANVLVILPKSDYHTEEEIKEIRDKVKSQLQEIKIDLFSLHELPQENTPAAIVTAQPPTDREQSLYTHRETPSGNITIEDVKHSEISTLMSALLAARLDLIHTTDTHFYEKYRAAMLSE